MSLQFFDDTGTDRRMTGTIASTIMPGWWIVSDDMGRKFRVASDQLWRVGDKVAVVGGQIVGRAGTAKAAKVVRV